VSLIPASNQGKTHVNLNSGDLLDPHYLLSLSLSLYPQFLEYSYCTHLAFSCLISCISTLRNLQYTSAFTGVSPENLFINAIHVPDLGHHDGKNQDYVHFTFNSLYDSHGGHRLRLTRGDDSWPRNKLPFTLLNDGFDHRFRIQTADSLTGPKDPAFGIHGTKLVT